MALADEVDGLNDAMIKQLIQPIGTQLKFRKALRALRGYVDRLGVVARTLICLSCTAAQSLLQNQVSRYKNQRNNSLKDLFNSFKPFNNNQNRSKPLSQQSRPK